MIMSEKLPEEARRKRRAYNMDYQKHYVKRYEFKPDSSYNFGLFRLFEQMESRNICSGEKQRKIPAERPAREI